MKKTLLALSVAAFATSASAITIYENEGSKVDFDGSIRVLLDNSGSKTKNHATGNSSTSRHHTNLKNDGSRFGVRMKHDLAEDFFAFGRLEFRFNSKDSTDEFGDLYAHRAYVGLGSKQYGEVSFGRQVTIGDDIAQTGFDNTYGILKTPLTDAGKSVIRYDYKGIEGLQVGADYRFAEKRDGKGEVVYDEDGSLKSGYGVGAVYGFDLAPNRSAKVAAGYTRDNYKTDGNYSHHRDAAMAGGKYTVDNLTLAADYGFESDRDGATKSTTHGIHTGVKYQVTPAIATYGNYVYFRGTEKTAGQKTGKERGHRVMLGTEYQVHKNVFTFVEGRHQVTKSYTASGVKTETTKDNSVGIGLRVFW
ncbi:hypothetical protein A1D22_00270 [Pasteurellaceae bacterium LFhippo2]|nr:hypothetical protein [Pasteurellaceae bacterium LFhippo2]